MEVNSSILSENAIINIPNNVKEVGRSLDFNLLMIAKYNINPKRWAALILIMLFKQKTVILKQYNGFIILLAPPINQRCSISKSIFDLNTLKIGF